MTWHHRWLAISSFVLATSILLVQCDDSSSSSEEISYDLKRLEELIRNEILTYIQLLMSQNDDELKSLLLISGADDDSGLYSSPGQASSVSNGNEVKNSVKRSGIAKGVPLSGVQTQFDQNKLNRKAFNGRSLPEGGKPRRGRVPNSSQMSEKGSNGMLLSNDAVYEGSRPGFGSGYPQKQGDMQFKYGSMRRAPQFYSDGGFGTNFGGQFRPENDQIEFRGMSGPEFNGAMNPNVNSEYQPGKRQSAFSMGDAPQLKDTMEYSSQRPRKRKERRGSGGKINSSSGSSQASGRTPEFSTDRWLDGSMTGGPLKGNMEPQFMMNYYSDNNGMMTDKNFEGKQGKYQVPNMQNQLMKGVRPESDGSSMSKNPGENGFQQPHMTMSQFPSSGVPEFSGKMMGPYSGARSQQSQLQPGLSWNIQPQINPGKSSESMPIPGSMQNESSGMNYNRFNGNPPSHQSQMRGVQGWNNPEVSKSSGIGEESFGSTDSRRGKGENRRIKVVILNGNEFPGKLNSNQKQTLTDSGNGPPASVTFTQGMHSLSDGPGRSLTSDGKLQMRSGSFQSSSQQLPSHGMLPPSPYPQYSNSFVPPPPSRFGNMPPPPPVGNMPPPPPVGNMPPPPPVGNMPPSPPFGNMIPPPPPEYGNMIPLSPPSVQHTQPSGTRSSVQASNSATESLVSNSPGSATEQGKNGDEVKVAREVNDVQKPKVLRLVRVPASPKR